MRTYSQEEIDEMIASGEVDQMIARTEALIAANDPSVLVIKGEQLIALSRLARRRATTDEQLDDAVAAVRKAGHTWDEIERVLHAVRPAPLPEVTARD